mmetsp:Transcript_67926/g.109462  ORF Transcript_67926/g.109462 Transcript_67926/m.109462 type:complete len:89 (-) Transcript_67926:3218-3484(-)
MCFIQSSIGTGQLATMKGSASSSESDEGVAFQKLLQPVVTMPACQPAASFWKQALPPPQAPLASEPWAWQAHPWTSLPPPLEWHLVLA